MGIKTWLGIAKKPKRKENRYDLRDRTDKFGDIRGGEALERLIAYDDITTVLDIGSGAGVHADIMAKAGKSVTRLSLVEPADVISDYLDYDAPAQFDAIWASHVLEHQPNVGQFLRKCFSDLRDGGVLAVTVPPLKHSIVGGHVALWNQGLLLYRLILAGFDCSTARVGGYDYDLSVIVRKVPADLPPDLYFNKDDIGKLAKFFPVPVRQGFDGRIPDTNWS